MDDRERADEPTRRRRRTTTLELEILEQEFSRCDKPSISERERISSLISRTDVDGPGMNSREIQVWFQNKRQAMRRAQGAYPLCTSADEGGRIRKADEQLFGIKLDPTQQGQSTPTGSFTSADDSGSSQAGVAAPAAPLYGLATPSSAAKVQHDRRARLVLSDVGDGHAELMFSPTPLKPSSPPRIPAMITPMRTPLSRKIAARSVSSPALLAFRTPMTSKTISFTPDTNVQSSSSATSLLYHDGNQRKTPLQNSSAINRNVLKSLKSLNGIKRLHDAGSPSTQESDLKRKRHAAAQRTSSHPELGRGKENIDPETQSSFHLARTPVRASDRRREEDTYGRDIRRIHSENLLPSWQSSTPRLDQNNSSKEASARTPRTDSTSPSLLPPSAPKKLSAEECALSLVSLAHGV